MAGAFILTCLAMLDGAMAARLSSESPDPVCRHPCNSPVVELQGKSFTIGRGVEYTATERQCMGECVIVMKGWPRTDGCGEHLPGSQKVSKTRNRKLCCQVLQCPTGSVVEDKPLITTTTTTTTRESPVCCMAVTADCLSCKAGKTKEEFCAEGGNDDVDGCEELRVEERDDAGTDETSMTTSTEVESTSATTATAEKSTTTATTATTATTTTTTTMTATTTTTTTASTTSITTITTTTTTTTMTTSSSTTTTAITTTTTSTVTTITTTAVITTTTTTTTTTMTTSSTTAESTIAKTTADAAEVGEVRQAGDSGVETDAPEEMVKAFGVSLAERLYAMFDTLDEMEGLSSAELEDMLSTTFSDNDKARLAAQGIV